MPRAFSIGPVTAICVVAAVTGAVAGEEHGRIKRPRATLADEARRASEDAMNDSILRKGDIVSTDHGFLLFQGHAADGSPAFVAVRNPLQAVQP